MDKFVFVVLLVFVSCAAPQECGKRFLGGTTKVVSGQTARAHSWPWQVSLRKVGSTFHFCGGSLINDQWVVTAAHCVKGKQASGLNIRLGEHNFNNGEQHTVDKRVERVIVHPRYGRLNYDIALIKLSSKVNLKPQISPICLPSQGNSVNEVTGSECYITGWGRTGANRPGAKILQEARLPVISESKCRQHMGSSVSRQMICAGFGGSSTVSGCMGDSGGPFVCRDRSSNKWYLHGAVSWGTRTCSAGQNEFTVFARVSEFIDWITQYVGNVPTPPRPTPPRPTPPRPTPPRPTPPRPTPSTPTPSSSSADCNFDKLNTCGYKSVNGKFQWTIRKGSTPSGGTGPSADVSGRGNYIYIEASNPRKPGDNAILESPMLSGPQCLTFQYHMYGAGIGTLNVRVNNNKVFSKSGNQGNAWRKYAVGIPVSGSYKVKFEGIVGKSYQGDIAIDEISFTPGRCATPTRPPQPTTPRPTRPPQPTTPQVSADCNFDKSNTCGYKSVNGKFQWTIRKGSTPSGGTGPSADVSGRGNYIYIEASSPQRPGDKAILESPVLSGPQCLTFQYHMYGAGIGTLNVRVNNNKVFSKSGNQENAWRKVAVGIPGSGSYKVQFEGIRGNNYQGDIAIDEISFTAGTCSTTPPQPSPPVPSPNPPTGQCGAKGPGLSDDPRIVGGQEATPGEWPWQVSLLRGSFPFCGGALVSNQYIITAAHCVSKNSWNRIKIRLGEHDFRGQDGHEMDISIAQNGITSHPSYNSRRTDYDIAVIKLSRPVQYNNRIKPVCINRGIDFTGQRCYITGWGRLSSGGKTPKKLQEAQVPIVTAAECRKSYGSSSITDRMICAGYRQGGIDTCQGDSGGPMVCRHRDGSWHLTGVTSWGRGCASPRYYGVYAHVAKLYSWVNKVTGL